MSSDRPSDRKRAFSAGDNENDENVSEFLIGSKTVVSRKAKRNKTKSAALSSSQPATAVTTEHGGTKVTDDNCVFCAGVCNEFSSLQCKTCLQYYHLNCCGVKQSLHSPVAAVLKVMSWSCTACQQDNSRVIRQLREDLDSLRTTVSMLQQAGCVSTAAASLVEVTASMASASTSSESRQAPATFADVTAGGPARAILAHHSSSVTRGEVSSLIVGAVNVL